MGKPVVEGSLESPPFEKPSIEQVNNQLFILFYFFCKHRHFFETLAFQAVYKCFCVLL